LHGVTPDGCGDFANDVEHAAGPAEFAEQYAAFSHWMLTTALQA
jgi:hypothetical protein